MDFTVTVVLHFSFCILHFPPFPVPDFAYTARDAAGQRVTGTLTAATRREALSTLDQRALFPLEVRDATAPSVRRGRRIKPQLMATAYGQLADLLRSGVPLLRSLDVLREQTSNAALADVLTQVRAQVEDGASLAEAMARHPRAFSEIAVSMARAGGEGGFMESALARVAQFTEQQEDLKGRTLGAVAYPIFLSCVGVIVVTGLIVVLVPKFEDLFKRLREKGELPALTDGLLALSHFLGDYGLWLLVALGIGFWYLRSWLATDRGRLTADRFKLRIPLAGTIFRNLAVARFCRVLGTLLQNGVPILKSLDIASAATANRVLAGAIQAAAENISAGQSLAKPLSSSGYFPRDVVEMIAVAEESNSLDTVLGNVADSLERLTWRRLDLAVRLLEPLMLLILAGAVLVVVIALLLPVLKMSLTM